MTPSMAPGSGDLSVHCVGHMPKCVPCILILVCFLRHSLGQRSWGNWLMQSLPHLQGFGTALLWQISGFALAKLRLAKSISIKLLDTYSQIHPLSLSNIIVLLRRCGRGGEKQMTN